MRILNRSLFEVRHFNSSVARQTCRIIGNEKNNNTIFEKCGTSADFAGHLSDLGYGYANTTRTLVTLYQVSDCQCQCQCLSDSMSE